MTKLDEDEVETILGCGLLLALFPMLAINVAVDAFVSRHIWAWLIVPEFSVSPLSWPAAIGIGLLASHWTHQHGYRKDSKASEAYMAMFSNTILYPSLLLLAAWVASVIVY